jgi:hypothetical protein
MNWLKIVEQLAPIIVSVAVPGAGPILASVITAGIHSAEGMINATPSEKLTHAIEIANATAAGINAVKPNTLDPNLVNAAAISVTSTIVNAANLVHNTPVKSVTVIK